jgi:hypothetical protein
MTSSLRVLLALFVASAGCTVQATHVPDAGAPDANDAVDAAEPIDVGTDAGPNVAVFIEPGAPSGTPGRFESTTTGPLDLTVAYPLDGVLLPPNLGGLEVHFAPASHDLYEVRFEQDGAPRVLVYDDCQARGGGCSLALSDAMWDALAAARAGGPFTVRVRGVQRSGGPIVESPPIEIELADEAVTGGLYFWTTEPPAIHRYDFDRGHRVSEIYYDSSDAEGHCVGCHAVSRDGHTIAIGYGTEGPIAIVDVASRVAARTLAGQMAAFSPDAADLVIGGIPERGVRTPLEIVRADGTGTPIALGFGHAPDWSPDGETIAATTDTGAIQLYDGAGSAWAARGTTLTTGGDTMFDQFASFAPDSDWIAFSRQSPTSGVGGVASQVWVTRRGGGEAHILGHASRGAIDSMPRWNPATFLHHGERLFWVTFTSDLAYGLDPSGRQRHIWMAAFAPSSTDVDPSRAAFLLPGQPSTGSSFIPQWTSTIQRQVCDETADCPTGEVCEDGVCLPDLI